MTDQLRKLHPTASITVGRFGAAVDIDGGTVVVGGPSASGSVRFGHARLFDAATGDLLFDLVAQDAGVRDRFGISVAISGDWVVIGAEENDDSGSNSGSAYVFDARTGAQVHKLLPESGEAGALFGHDVGLSGNLAIVGAPHPSVDHEFPGRAYIFDVTTGEQVFELVPETPEIGTLFGDAVAIEGDLAVVGAHLSGLGTKITGAAYLFDTRTGEQIGTLHPEGTQIGNAFGFEIAMSPDTIAVTSATVLFFEGPPETGHDPQRAVYLFERSGAPRAALIPTESGPQFFASAVDISGSTLLVGGVAEAPNGDSVGAAIAFDAFSGEVMYEILPGDGASLVAFGSDVALFGDRAVVGAPGDDDFGFDAGAAYLFGPLCLGDCNQSGAVDFNDLLTILFFFGMDAGVLCDADGSGAIDFGDLVAALFLFGSCP